MMDEDDTYVAPPVVLHHRELLFKAPPPPASMITTQTQTVGAAAAAALGVPTNPAPSFNELRVRCRLVPSKQGPAPSASGAWYAPRPHTHNRTHSPPHTHAQHTGACITTVCR